ncbi:hypothetical protein [uncultured Winogradskyella sp.]|uniref:hypothetical protein n=1 Tax=uncultured Winogradskyella sp. TaxID=395353 RepID=UPI002634426D|nr:hypothetical protein [uncultured Winogradskyella sp.]
MLAKQDDNIGGLNVLGDGPFYPNPIDTWNQTNKPWLLNAINAGGVLRATANPINASNLFFSNVTNISFSNWQQVKNYMLSFSENSTTFIDELGFYGKEVHTFVHQGLNFNPITNTFQ